MSKAGYQGSGWAFPPSFGNNGSNVQMVSADQDILQSLQILLNTSPGERIMLADFGCDLSAFMFEEINQSLINQITRNVSDAILKHEPRIRMDQLEVTPAKDGTGVVDIRLSFTSLLSNSRYNLVYPFYLNEAVINV